MKVRSKAEIQDCIDRIEEIYPEGKESFHPIANYFVGILAGLKCALGEYPSFAEMDLTDFIDTTYDIKQLKCARARRIKK